MIWIAVAIIGLIALLSAGFWLAFWSIGLILKLAIAGLIGGLADMAIPGRLPYGWLGAVIAGIAGGWVGGLLLGDFGIALPIVGNVIPTFVGALVVVGGYELVAKTRALPPAS